VSLPSEDSDNAEILKVTGRLGTHHSEIVPRSFFEGDLHDLPREHSVIITPDAMDEEFKEKQKKNQNRIRSIPWYPPQ